MSSLTRICKIISVLCAASTLACSSSASRSDGPILVLDQAAADVLAADQALDAWDRGDGIERDGALGDDGTSMDAEAEGGANADGSAVDGALADALAADGAGADGTVDGAVTDSSSTDAVAVDGQSVDASNDALAAGIVYGVVRRGAEPALDGRGTLYLALYGLGLPPPYGPPAAKVIIPQADLSDPDGEVRYAFSQPVAPGVYTLYAFLDDNHNAVGTIPFGVEMPDAGDLVALPFPVDTAGNAAVQADVLLSSAQGAPTDGGVGGDGPRLGALRGTLGLATKPVLDGRGLVIVTLHSTPPPSPAVAQTSVAAADLSSPYGRVGFFLGSLAPGKYYLDAWLDDNANYNVFFPGPDATDLVLKAPLPVRIEDNLTATVDVALNMVKP